MATRTTSVFDFYLKGSGLEYELLVCDDGSEATEKQGLRALPNIKYCEVPIQEHGYNAVLSMNALRRQATGDVFILCGAETFPTNRRFVEVATSCLPGTYHVGACLALGIVGTIRALTVPIERLQSVDWVNQDARWYQHSKYDNRKLNFFSIIARVDWDEVSGFNRGMASQDAGDDVEFLSRIMEKIDVVVDDEMQSVHMCHYLNGDGHFNGHISWTSYGKPW